MEHALKQHAERLNFALFLHNDVAQGLSAVGVQLDLLRMDLEKQLPDAAARITAIQELLDDVLIKVRTFSRSLRPGAGETEVSDQETAK